jgi:vancomycin resistance protein YoaR
LDKKPDSGRKTGRIVMLPFFKKNCDPQKPRRHWPLYLAAVFFILLDLAISAYLIFEEYYKNKIYPGVTIGNIDLGGKTMTQAKNILSGRVDDIVQNGFTFTFDNQKTQITPIISSFNGDVALQIIDINTNSTTNNAFAFGRGQDIKKNLSNQLEAILHGRHIDASYSIDYDRTENILKNNFKQLDEIPRNAQLYATTTLLFGKNKINLSIIPEKIGYNFDYDKALNELKLHLANLDETPITLSATEGSPSIRSKDIEPIKTEAEKFLDSASLTLTYKNEKWLVGEDVIATWLTATSSSSNSLALSLSETKISDYLSRTVAKQIEVPSSDARFEIKDGRVVQFNKNQDGVKINLNQTYQNLLNDFLTNKKSTVDISMATVTSEIAASQTNNLGVTEIIGTGHSNFSGSSKSRITNIKLGAATLNGILIPPGAEFSTDKSLGTVNASTGYLPEMSIMGNKTIAEYGGGLCQIGTTLFRAALNSGLPITARQAHSYRVSYYEPAGTDATIYQPWPDLRFINDTPNYVLIQSRISGNDIYFDFWGTKDGRVVEQTDPTIYNIVKPQAAKYVETTDLAPGQKKCTERAHNGADAFFDYKVTYTNGTIKEKRFSSHYVPWQEVCLIGVEKLSTSTPAINSQ